MFPHWMAVTFSWVNHICGSAMLFMSLNPAEVVLTSVPPKQCRKVVSHTTKFSFFTIYSKHEQKDTATTTVSEQEPSIQQNKLDKIAAKKKNFFFTQSS
jgi:hypothetical protein